MVLVRVMLNMALPSRSVARVFCMGLLFFVGFRDEQGMFESWITVSWIQHIV